MSEAQSKYCGKQAEQSEQRKQGREKRKKKKEKERNNREKKKEARALYGGAFVQRSEARRRRNPGAAILVEGKKRSKYLKKRVAYSLFSATAMKMNSDDEFNVVIAFKICALLCSRLGITNYVVTCFRRSLS